MGQSELRALKLVGRVLLETTSGDACSLANAVGPRMCLVPLGGRGFERYIFTDTVVLLPGILVIQPSPYGRKVAVVQQVHQGVVVIVEELLAYVGHIGITLYGPHVLVQAQ